MGENRWRAENEWPLARTHYTRYYLHADAQPTPATGGRSLDRAPPETNRPTATSTTPTTLRRPCGAAR